ILADKLSDELGSPVIVENVVGASGNVAGDRVAKAEPDGYTLVLAASSAIVINPSIYKKMTYDPIRDLAPISRVCSYANILTVNNDLPVKSVHELVELARTRPGVLTYGHPGAETTIHLSLSETYALKYWWCNPPRTGIASVRPTVWMVRGI